MGHTDTTVAPEAAPRVEEQLQNIDAQLQDLLKQDSLALPCLEPRNNSEAASSSVLPPLAQPAVRRRTGVKRLIRPALGAGFLVLSAWALLPLLLSVHSTQAVINAPLVTLRSPIEGTVNFRCPMPVGASARANAPLFNVKGFLTDEERLDALKDERSYLEAKVSSSRQELTNLSAMQDNLAASARKYQAARLRTLELECDEARARLDGARSVEQQRNSEKDQLAQLEKNQSVSGLDAAATRFAVEAAHHGVVQAQKSVENLEAQIRFLRDGVNVGPSDGHNDLPSSAQRLHEVGFRVEEIRAALSQDEAKLAQIERHIAAENERVSRRGQYTAALPAQSIVWRRYVAGETLVAADSPLLDVIDPAEIFVDAAIAESDLPRVKIGEPATVRWAGSNKQWKAVVKGVFGRSLPWPDRLLAVESVSPSRHEAHVVLRFDEPLVEDGKAVSIPVGAAAEVTFISTGGALKKLCGLSGK